MVLGALLCILPTPGQHDLRLTHGFLGKQCLETQGTEADYEGVHTRDCMFQRFN